MAIDKPLDPNVLIQFPLLTEDAIRMKQCYDNDHDPYSRYGDWDLIAVKEEWVGNHIKNILYFQCPRCHHVEEDEVEGDLSEEEKKELEKDLNNEESEAINNRFAILFEEDEEKLKDKDYAKKVAIANILLIKIIKDINLKDTSSNIMAMRNLKADIINNLVKDESTGEFRLDESKKMVVEYDIANDNLAIPKITEVGTEFPKEFIENSPITAIKSEMKAQEKKQKQISKVWKKAQKKQKRQEVKTEILKKLVILNVFGLNKSYQKRTEIAVEKPIDDKFIEKQVPVENKNDIALNVLDIKDSKGGVTEISIKETETPVAIKKQEEIKSNNKNIAEKSTSENKINPNPIFTESVVGPVAMTPNMQIEASTESKEEVKSPVKEVAKEQEIIAPEKEVKEEKHEYRNTGNSRPTLGHKEEIEELTEEEKMENIVKFEPEEEKLATLQKDLAESSVSDGTIAEEITEEDNVNIDFPTLNNNPENTPEETEENVVPFENPNSKLMTPMPNSSPNIGGGSGENAA